MLLVVVGLSALVSRLTSPSRLRRGFGSEARRTRYRLLGNLLLGSGLASLVVAVLVYVTDFASGDRVLPAPVALAGTSVATSSDATGTPTPVGAPPLAVAAPSSGEGAGPTATVMVTTTSVPTRTPVPSPTLAPVKPGVPVRIVIPSIGVDSKVQEIGTVWVQGELQWETVPFVVGHYRTTAKAGENGNAVFSGHVTSRNAGNVFRDLYKISLGDEIQIYTAEDRITYVVTSVRLVLPTETSVMNPTPDPTATLITCAGEWMPAERNYSHRLVVSAKLKR